MMFRKYFPVQQWVMTMCDWEFCPRDMLLTGQGITAEHHQDSTGCVQRLGAQQTLQQTHIRHTGSMSFLSQFSAPSTQHKNHHKTQPHAKNEALSHHLLDLTCPRMCCAGPADWAAVAPSAFDDEHVVVTTTRCQKNSSVLAGSTSLTSI
jgi:hypothetical protein